MVRPVDNSSTTSKFRGGGEGLVEKPNEFVIPSEARDPQLDRITRTSAGNRADMRVSRQTEKPDALIATSRTRLLLLSGWGCRGRRLSRGGGNLCRPPWLWRCYLALRMRDRIGDARVLLWVRLLQSPDGRGFSGTRQRLLCLDARPDTLLRAHKPDKGRRTQRRPGQVPLTRKGKRLQAPPWLCSNHCGSMQVDPGAWAIN